MTEQELKWAQLDVYTSASKLAQAGLRLDGTKYEDQYRKALEAVRKLNQMLIEAITKNK